MEWPKNYVGIVIVITILRKRTLQSYRSIKKYGEHLQSLILVELDGYILHTKSSRRFELEGEMPEMVQVRRISEITR